MQTNQNWKITRVTWKNRDSCAWLVGISNSIRIMVAPQKLNLEFTYDSSSTSRCVPKIVGSRDWNIFVRHYPSCITHLPKRQKPPKCPATEMREQNIHLKKVNTRYTDEPQDHLVKWTNQSPNDNYVQLHFGWGTSSGQTHTVRVKWWPLEGREVAPDENSFFSLGRCKSFGDW